MMEDLTPDIDTQTGATEIVATETVAAETGGTETIATERDDAQFIEGLLKGAKKEIDVTEVEPSFPLPGSGAKSDVLLNAIGVFTCKGIAETTVQDLLDAANISRRTFYKYFKNKVDVLESLYKLTAEILSARIKSERSVTNSLSEFIMSCVDIYFDFHATLGPLLRMMTEEARRSGSPLAPHREASIDNVVSLFDDKYYEVEGAHPDRLALYALIWAIESASIDLLTNTDGSEEVVARYKSVMRAFASRIISPSDDDRPDLPLL